MIANCSLNPDNHSLYHLVMVTPISLTSCHNKHYKIVIPNRPKMITKSVTHRKAGRGSLKILKFVARRWIWNALNHCSWKMNCRSALATLAIYEIGDKIDSQVQVKILRLHVCFKNEYWGIYRLRRKIWIKVQFPECFVVYIFSTSCNLAHSIILSFFILTAFAFRAFDCTKKKPDMRYMVGWTSPKPPALTSFLRLLLRWYMLPIENTPSHTFFIRVWFLKVNLYVLHHVKVRRCGRIFR